VWILVTGHSTLKVRVFKSGLFSAFAQRVFVNIKTVWIQQETDRNETKAE